MACVKFYMKPDYIIFEKAKRFI